MSGTVSRASGVRQGMLQVELRHRLGHPLLRALRLAPFEGLADILNFFLALRLVKPTQVRVRCGHWPRAQDLLLLFISVKAGMSAGPWPILGLTPFSPPTKAMYTILDAHQHPAKSAKHSAAEPQPSGYGLAEVSPHPAAHGRHPLPTGEGRECPFLLPWGEGGRGTRWGAPRSAGRGDEGSRNRFDKTHRRRRDMSAHYTAVISTTKRKAAVGKRCQWEHGVRYRL